MSTSQYTSTGTLKMPIQYRNTEIRLITHVPRHTVPTVAANNMRPSDVV
jgi:hypothetical protein